MTEELRGQLLDWLHEWLDAEVAEYELEDRLLPIVAAYVEQQARERAAEELENVVLDAVIVGEVMHERGPIRVPVTYLTERAAALRGQA